MRCSFCGYQSPDHATSCVACGNVFGAVFEAASGAPAAPRPADHAPEPFDPEPVAKAAVQARWMLVASALLSVVAAVVVVAAVSSRFGIVPLADESLTVGALVMAGGWAQQVAEQGQRLGGSVAPGRALSTWPMTLPALWRESAPSVETDGDVPGAVTLTQWLVVAALVLRLASLALTAPAVVVVSRGAWVAAALQTARLAGSVTPRQVQRSAFLRAVEGG